MNKRRKRIQRKGSKKGIENGYGALFLYVQQSCGRERQNEINRNRKERKSERKKERRKKEKKRRKKSKSL